MHTRNPDNTPQTFPVSLPEAVAYWLKLGFVSFGGPAGQIAIMHRDLVEKKRWISEKRFLHALNYCMVLPGPEAQQLATYIGWLMHRTWGGIIAGGLFVLPSFFILVALAWIYMAFGSQPLVAGLFYGIKPAVVAIVLAAAHRIGARTLKNKLLWAIACLAFAAIYLFEIPFPLIMLTAGILGYLGGRIAPENFMAGGRHNPADKDFGAALIDDATPTPEHARFSWAKFMRVAVSGIVIWLAAMGALVALYGIDSPYAKMGWFFTKAALLTFGGAYAVLPYVYQGAVEHHHWLSAAQMIDGLALGETTPGPLIMVVTFVGFTGGWQTAGGGFVAALIAAAAVTFFTFLPSFVFILLGGPFIETTHGNIKLTAPLTAVTAAVVGVIASLALFFASHVFWPGGFRAGTEWLSVLLAAGAAVAMLRFKTGAIPVILTGGVLGALVKMLA